MTSAMTSAVTTAVASDQPSAFDRFERPALVWYLLFEPGIAAMVVLSVSDRAYAAAAELVPVPPRQVIRALAVGTVVLHVGESIAAYRMARHRGMNGSARRWAVDAAIVGFPSLLKMAKVAGR